MSILLGYYDKVDKNFLFSSFSMINVKIYSPYTFRQWLILHLHCTIFYWLQSVHFSKFCGWQNMEVAFYLQFSNLDSIYVSVFVIFPHQFARAFSFSINFWSLGNLWLCKMKKLIVEVVVCAAYNHADMYFFICLWLYAHVNK